ncbi:MAG: hypothetical protein HQ483_15470 [Rhodospirillales bacterium]|nr:hypothetical protein [Rhodospirillales bacterium]
MFGHGYGRIKRRLRWAARAVGVFGGLFAYEYVSANPHPDVFGAADPYAAAVVGYILGNLLLTLAVVWLLRRIWGLFGSLRGRR